MNASATQMATGTAEAAQQSSGLRLRTDPRQVQFKHLLESPAMQKSLQAALPKHLNPGRMIRVVLGAMQRNPDLLKCSPESVLVAIMQSAALGMEPDGILGQGYLIPYKQQCQFIIGYRGLCQLARQSGQISKIWAEVVFEKDAFDYEFGLDPKLTHKRNDTVEDPGALKYAYACALFKDGSTQFVVLNRREVMKAKSSSASAGSSKSPWTSHEPEMWKKTAVRRLAKMLPLSVEVQSQLHAEERAEDTGEPINLPDLPMLPDLPELPAIEGMASEHGGHGDDSGEMDSELMTEAAIAFAGCSTASGISNVQENFRNKAQTEAERTAINGLADDARARVKGGKVGAGA